jgi:hypothetical protein
MAPKQGHKNRFTIVSSGRVNVLQMRLSRHPADSKKKAYDFRHGRDAQPFMVLIGLFFSF